MASKSKMALVLSEAERAQLLTWARRPSTPQTLALRSRIVLACADGAEGKAVAAKLAVTQHTVSKWRARFVALRLDGLPDAARSGAPRRIDDARIEAVIAKTLASQPANAASWSTRAMAREANLSQSAVSRIWRSAGLAPHRQHDWAGSAAARELDALRGRLRDIAAVYLDGPLRAMVLLAGADGATVQDVAPELRLPDYLRLGAGALFGALEHSAAKAGQRHARQRSNDFLKFITGLERAWPGQEQLHVLVDHGGKDFTPTLRDWLARHPRVRAHAMPAAAWLEQVERGFAVLTERQTREGTERSMLRLQDAVRVHLKSSAGGAEAQPFLWPKAAPAAPAAGRRSGSILASAVPLPAPWGR